MDTLLDTYENKRLFMRAFVLYIQKCFLLATSSANVMPRTLPTIFDMENTRRRNWALHVHNFLLEEGLVKTRQMKDENDRLQKKNPKNNASSESESESEYEESSSN
ncbi:hypothetical protein PIB30_050856 [Stylosanthes scabra]|uniref:Uncharacterized protein n=1 Tax=Stylosanthes scabra TaxID=79078 RepID=A0ABU6QHA1_9FABA|nr:hypothetical protein [Stylosanthes scabra]